LTAAVLSVVGRGNVGKTTFLVGLVVELKKRGYRVATIKHFERDFETDKPGKDSWRLTEAGSDVSIIAAPQKVAMVRRLQRELSLDEIVASLPEMDIVLTEGYKQDHKPKIEVVRQAVTRELIFAPPELVAVVSDMTFEVNVPQFALEDASGVATLIEQNYIKANRP
jgi:molybdopterin-guanine dinucleotide biosynthesis protein MobB